MCDQNCFAVVKADVLPESYREGRILVVQPQAKLNRAWLVALSIDSTETRRTEESVWIAEVRAIEDISELSFKPEVQFLLDWKDLEDVDVFVVGGESAY
jgi:regulator of RNase E activity RraA